MTWHGEDRERPGQYRVVIQHGSIVRHWTLLSKPQHDALLRKPTIHSPEADSRVGVKRLCARLGM